MRPMYSFEFETLDLNRQKMSKNKFSGIIRGEREGGGSRDVISGGKPIGIESKYDHTH